MNRLITKPVIVNVTYWRPDYRSILQQFMWTTDDVVPELVRVHRFLNYWREHIEAVIHDVEVSVPHQMSWRSVEYFKGYVQ